MYVTSPMLMCYCPLSFICILIFGSVFGIEFESMVIFICAEEEDENVDEEEEEDDDDFKNDVLRLFIRMDQFSRYSGDH